MVSLTVLFIVAAFVLSVLALVRSKGKSEIAWAVLFLSLVHLLGLPLVTPH
jgi:hypothetical protein